MISINIFYLIKFLLNSFYQIQCFAQVQDCLTLPDFENVQVCFRYHLLKILVDDILQKCCNFPKNGGKDDVINCESMYANKGLPQNTLECVRKYDFIFETAIFGK